MRNLLRSLSATLFPQQPVIQDDITAIRSDWEAVGGDLWAAIRSYDPGERERQGR